jgi:hypothetical protein
MPLKEIFWVLMIIWFLFGVAWNSNSTVFGTWGTWGNWLLLFVLFFILGWKDVNAGGKVHRFPGAKIHQ